VLIRMSRGSGIAGLGAMARMAKLPGGGDGDIKLARPLLGIPKSRLIATLRAAKIPFADDPSNRDPRFTRARLRELMPQLAREGLDARRLALLAFRLKRADAAIEAAVDRASVELTANPAMQGSNNFGTIVYDASRFARLPAEIGLRLIGRAVAKTGDEGPVELGKLEALKAALDAAQKAGNSRFRRSLAGALVTLAANKIAVERAPSRRQMSLTKRFSGQAKRPKAR
jgi:tRNA(Ile)-lysidine synthase